MRLFRAWSMAEDFMGQGQVRLDWFVVGRTEPLAPFEEFIQSYDENDENCCYDQMLLNELLAEDEAEELKAYLAAIHSLDVQLEEVNLPLRSGGLSYGLLLISGERGFYALADEEGYGLSVPILGHYDEKKVSSARLLSNQAIDNGVQFLQMVFNNLDIPNIERDDLKPLLQKIYVESKLHVVEER